jgi:putative N6-adenine-specific DNA methylase
MTRFSQSKKQKVAGPRGAAASNSSKTKSSTAEVESGIGHESPEGTDHESVADFYVVCLPGWEEETADEIKAQLPDVECRIERGGVAISAPLRAGFYLNHSLRTATRVLLRLATFGCRDFPKLFKKMSSFSWEDWIDDRSPVSFEVSVQSSRMKMKNRIAETALDGRVGRLKKRGRPHARFEGPPVTVFLRVVDDVCTVSLDTSGEILHKRGERAMSSAAPLRESTAAAILLWLVKQGDLAGLAKPGEDTALIDPMVGGGTFLLEAAAHDDWVKNRSFAYQTLTVYKNMVPSEQMKVPVNWSFGRLFGFDIDAKALDAATQNLRSRAERVYLGQNDLFLNTKGLLGHFSGRRWVIVNPPYDERIEAQKSSGLSTAGSLKDYYEKLFSAIEQTFQPEIVSCLVPEKGRDLQPLSLKTPAGWKRVGFRRFSNGGIAVVALAFRCVRN